MYQAQKLVDSKNALDIGKKAFLSQAVVQVIFLAIVICNSNTKASLIISYIVGIGLTIMYDCYKKTNLKDCLKNLSAVAVLVDMTYGVDRFVYDFF